MVRPRQQTLESTLGRPRVPSAQVRQTRSARRQTLTSPLAPRTGARSTSRHPVSDGPSELGAANSHLDDEGEGDDLPQPSKTAETGTLTAKRAKMAGSSEYDGPNNGASPRALSTKAKHKATIIISSDNEDDEEDDALPSASFKSRRAAKAKSSAKAAPPAARQEDEGEDDEEDDVITLGPKARAASQRRLGKRAHKTSDEEDVPSTRGRRAIVVDSEDDSDHGRDEVGPGSSSPPGFGGNLGSAKRRKLLRPNQERAMSSSQPDLAPERTPGVGSSPFRLRPKKQSKNQRARDILTHRRENRKSGRPALENEEELSDGEEESEEEEARALYDPDPEYQALDIFDDEEASDENANGPARGVAGRDNGDGLAEDDEDSQEDADNDAPQYGPRLEDMPFSHSADAHRPPDQQFYLCVEWIVSFLLNPRAEEARKDRNYINAWDKVNQLLEGLAHSTYISTSWKADFNLTLRARPKMESFELGAVAAIERGVDHCTGCNRTNHPIKYMVTFQGRPYNMSIAAHRIARFLEEVEQDGDAEGGGADQDGEDEGPQYDENNRRIEPESREWYLGADCHANAEMTHMLLHWKRALFVTVAARLAAEGRAADDTTLAKSAAVRELAVINTINDWQRAGFLSRLWSDFETSKARAEVEEGRSKRRSGPSRRP